MQFWLDIIMYFDLMIEKWEQTDMEFNLGQNIWDIGKEIVALNIEKNWYVSFVSHGLINFFNFQVHVNFLILFINLLCEIIFFRFFRNHIFRFVRYHIWYLRTDTCLSNYLVSCHVALTARKGLQKTILSYNRWFFLGILSHIVMIYEINHWYPFVFINSQHLS